MAAIPSIFSSWPFFLIVLAIIYVYLLFYDTEKALRIGQAIIYGLYKLVTGVFVILYRILIWIVDLFR